MALTNAERQKRHRDRQKEALRNVEGGVSLSLPAAYAKSLRHDSKRNSLATFRTMNISMLDKEDREEQIAEYVAETVKAILMDMEFYNKSKMGVIPNEVMSILGGSEYIEALLDWSEALSIWTRSRKKDKGPRPSPPAPPPPIRIDQKPATIVAVDRSYVAPDDAW